MQPRKEKIVRTDPASVAQLARRLARLAKPAEPIEEEPLPGSHQEFLLRQKALGPRKPCGCKDQ